MYVYRFHMYISIGSTFTIDITYICVYRKINNTNKINNISSTIIFLLKKNYIEKETAHMHIIYFNVIYYK